MKLKIKAAGIGKVITELRSIGEKVPDAARKAMRRSAQRILENAKAYAPEDFGNLANAIILNEDYGYRGRLEMDISIEPTGREMTKPRGKLKGAGFSNAKPRAVDVLQYALLVHENYETHVAHVNGPGPETLRKMAANPGKVGSGFLTRAGEEEREKLMKNLIAVVDQVIERERQ